MALHASRASYEGGDANNRRCPGDVFEEVEQLIDQSGIRITCLDAAKMHEQPGHLQHGANRKNDRQSPTELRHQRIAVEHHRVSFGTNKRYPSPRCVSISTVA